MGFDLLRNFNVPYFAKNIPEIWRRFHMSLYNWVRDYLFFALTKMRARGLKLLGALMLTMIIMGFWHAASANYVLWGIYQGSLLCLYAITKPFFKKINIPTQWTGLVLIAQIFFIFNLKAFGSLIGFSHSVKDILFYLHSIIADFRITPRVIQWTGKTLFFYWMLLLMDIMQYRSGDHLIFLRLSPKLKTILSLIAIYSIFYSIIFLQWKGTGEFVYVRF